LTKEQNPLVLVSDIWQPFVWRNLITGLVSRTCRWMVHGNIRKKFLIGLSSTVLRRVNYSSLQYAIADMMVMY